MRVQGGVPPLVLQCMAILIHPRGGSNTVHWLEPPKKGDQLTGPPKSYRDPDPKFGKK